MAGVCVGTLAYLPFAGYGRRSRAHAIERAFGGGVSGFLRDHFLPGEFRLDHVARARVVQHHFRFLQFCRTVREWSGSAGLAARLVAATHRDEDRHHATTFARSRQTPLRIQHILGVPLVQPVHVDLVREPTGGDGLLHSASARVLAAVVCTQLVPELGGSVFCSLATPEQTEAGRAGARKHRSLGGALAGSLPDDYAGLLWWKAPNRHLGDWD